MNNKELINQYVDTGLRLPETQIAHLPNWAKKTYIRKRKMSVENGGKKFNEYELGLLDKEYISKYLGNRVKSLDMLEDYEFLHLSNEGKNELAINRANNGYHLNDEMFKTLLDYQKKEYITRRLKSNNPLSALMLKYCDEKTVESYLNGRIVTQLGSFAAFQPSQRDTYPVWFENLDFKDKIKTFELMIFHILKHKLSFEYIYIEDKYYSHLGPIRKSFLAGKVKEEDPYFSELLFNDLSEKQKIEYMKLKFKSDADAYFFRWEKPYIKYLNNEQ